MITYLSNLSIYPTCKRGGVVVVAGGGVGGWWWVGAIILFIVKQIPCHITGEYDEQNCVTNHVEVALRHSTPRSLGLNSLTFVVLTCCDIFGNVSIFKQWFLSHIYLFEFCKLRHNNM